MPTFASDLLLKQETFKNTLMVRGEGEEALTGIVEKASLDPASSSDINIYRGGITNVLSSEFINSGKVMDFPKYPDFSPAFIRDLFNGKEDMIRLESSRGCYWNCCTFCSVKDLYSDTEKRFEALSCAMDPEYRQTIH